MGVRLRVIGRVVRIETRSRIEIAGPYSDALLGIEQFSHLILLLWMHRSDTRKSRAILRVHPCADPENPLTGVFATRSPCRPNPIGVFVTRLQGREGNVLRIGEIDAFDGTPVLDIKPYIPASDTIVEARVPGWVGRRGRPR